MVVAAEDELGVADDHKLSYRRFRMVRKEICQVIGVSLGKIRQTVGVCEGSNEIERMHKQRALV